jgi:hypothetical protein
MPRFRALTVKATGVAVRVLKVAEILVVPLAKASTSPLLTVATAGLVELQLTALVKSRVLPSEKVPVRVYCKLLPLRIVWGVLGVMAILCKVAAVTARASGLLVIGPTLAVMLVLPAVRPLASPLELMVATPVLEEAQVALALKFWVVPSE